MQNPASPDVRFTTLGTGVDPGPPLRFATPLLPGSAGPTEGRNTTYAVADFAFGAFASFFMQSPSFLAHQRHLATGQGRSNCETLFAMLKIPGDCSDKIHCSNCSHRKRGKSGIEYFHTMLAATLVAPGHNRAVPLAPKFIVPQDGHDKQDCESRAARRWLAAHGARYAPFQVYLGDDLFSRQPLCEAVRASGGYFLFVCKPDSHKAIEECRAGIVLDELTQKVGRGKQWVTHCYQWLRDVPLRGDADAIAVNWLIDEIRDARGELTYRNSFVTDLAVERDNVAQLATCGRARWKIENEGFNALKSKAYNPEHNFGHGKRNLSMVLAILNLLAFAYHTVCELGGGKWRAAMRELMTRQGFFQALRIITTLLVFASWDDLLGTLAFIRPPRWDHDIPHKMPSGVREEGVRLK